jgi:hypothetical protein
MFRQIAGFLAADHVLEYRPVVTLLCPLGAAMSLPHLAPGLLALVAQPLLRRPGSLERVLEYLGPLASRRQFDFQRPGVADVSMQLGLDVRRPPSGPLQACACCLQLVAA